MIFQKRKVTNHYLKACTIGSDFEKKGNIKKYFAENTVILNNLSKDSLIVSSPEEMRIKEKIERIGTPLKDWDVNINYGIKTGFNEAFIISGAMKDELIRQDPKSAEIIRPILRGRDIKRYKAEFADLWLINTHNGIKEKNLPPINVEDYPAIKRHLDQYYDKLEKRQDKGETPYNLRNCAYLEEFNRQKIIYPNMTKFLPFYLDCYGFITNQKCFIIIGTHLEYIIAFLNSSLFKFCFRNSFPELQGGTRELSKIYFEKISNMKINDSINDVFVNLLHQIDKLNQQNKTTKHIERLIDKELFNIYSLTDAEKKKIGFIEIR